jgi:hypothetical protein
VRQGRAGSTVAIKGTLHIRVQPQPGMWAAEGSCLQLPVLLLLVPLVLLL